MPKSSSISVSSKKGFKNKKIMREKEKDGEQGQHREIVLKDPPSKSFLEENIKAEKEAIDNYLTEASRTNDLALKRSIGDLSHQEMEHLEFLESIQENIKEKEKKTPSK